jgi:hypothetical protein
MNTHIKALTTLQRLGAGLLITCLSACSQLPSLGSAPNSTEHDQGWRQGVVEEVGPAHQLNARSGVDCRPPQSRSANVSSTASEAPFARVIYRHHKIRLERIVPLSSDQALPRVGQDLRFQVKDCQTPARPL